MIRLTDGKKTVEIEMCDWTGSGYTPDWSRDFFEVGGLPYDDENNVYIVDDVDYCVEQARDWEHGVGDFYYDDDPNLENHCVTVEYK